MLAFGWFQKPLKIGKTMGYNIVGKNLSNLLTVQLERIFDPLTDDRIQNTLLYKLVEPIEVHALHFVVIVSHMIDPAQVAYAYIG